MDYTYIIQINHMVQFLPHARLVLRAGAYQRLQPLQFALLMHFVENPNKVVPVGELIEAVWGRGTIVANYRVQQLVSEIRKIIEINPKEPKQLVTFYGEGYLFYKG